MKLAPIFVFCLAVSVHQAIAAPSIFDAISGGIRNAGSMAQGFADTAGSVASGAAGTAGSIASGIAEGASGAAQGAIGAATGIAKGVIGAGTEAVAGLADQAASVVKTISEKIENVKNKALKGALQHAQNSLQKIQDGTRGTLQATETIAKHAEEGVIEIENQKNEMIQEWAEKAQNKLANSSAETQEKGQDIIDGFVSARSEAIKEATDKVVETLEGLQEKASATANRYHEPMNKLIEQVGKCSEIKASQVRDLVKCASEIRKDLEPLASAPGQLAAVKGELLKAGAQNIAKNIKVQKAMNDFRNQSKKVEEILDQLVAQENKKPEEEKLPAEEQDQPEGEEKPEEKKPEEEKPEEKKSEEEQSSEEQSSEEQSSEERAEGKKPSTVGDSIDDEN